MHITIIIIILYRKKNIKIKINLVLVINKITLISPYTKGRKIQKKILTERKNNNNIIKTKKFLKEQKFTIFAF